MADFYAYLWLREDGTPYYIGKGHGLRGFRSKHHTVRRPKDTARIAILPRSSEQEAFDTEIELIDNWGRLDLGTGCLWNRSNGGEGSTNVAAEVNAKRAECARAQWANSEFREKAIAGMKKAHASGFTLEHIAALSAAHNGLPGNRKKGTSLSEQHKANLKLAWVARRKRLESGEELHWAKRVTISRP